MQFDKTYLTEAGRELATSTQGGLDKIQFTRAVASSHDYSASSIEDIKALTDIADVKQEVQYSRIVKKDKVTLTMRVDFPSKDVTTDYSLYTVGFYARLENGDEALYGVLPSSLPDYIPAYDGHSNINDSFQTDTTVSDTDNVLITVSQAGSLNETDLEAIFTAKHIATIEYIKDNLPDDIAKTGSDNAFTGVNTFEKDPKDVNGNAYITSQTAKDTLTGGKDVVADNGDDTLQINGKKVKPVADNGDNSITVNGKSYVPVQDNGDGTISVAGLKFEPADKAHVITVNEAGTAEPANFDDGTLTIGKDTTVMGTKVFYENDDYTTFAASHPNTMIVVKSGDNPATVTDTGTTTDTGSTGA